MKSRLLVLFLGIFIALFSFNVEASQADQIERRAIITSIEGSVLVQPAGQAVSLPASVGNELNKGDRIITGSDGRAEIRFDDGSVSRISPGSRVQIESLYRESSEGSETTFLNVDWGRLWNRVQDVVGRNSRFEVNTPSSVAGVRGTAFLVDVQENDDTVVRVYGGQVGVRSGKSTPAEDSDEQEILVSPHQQANVKHDAPPPAAPEPLDVMAVDSWEKDNLVEDVPVAYVEVETEVKTIVTTKLEEQVQAGRKELAMLAMELEQLRALQQEATGDRLAELQRLEGQLIRELEIKRDIVREVDRERQEVTAEKERFNEIRERIDAAAPDVTPDELNRLFRDEAQTARQEEREREKERQERQREREEREREAQGVREDTSKSAEELGVSEELERARENVTPEIVEKITGAQSQEEFEEVFVETFGEEYKDLIAPPSEEDVIEEEEEQQQEEQQQTETPTGGSGTTNPRISIDSISNITMTDMGTKEITVNTPGVSPENVNLSVAYNEEIVYVEIDDNNTLVVTGIKNGETAITVTANSSGYRSNSRTFTVNVIPHIYLHIEELEVEDNKIVTLRGKTVPGMEIVLHGDELEEGTVFPTEGQPNSEGEFEFTNINLVSEMEAHSSQSYESYLWIVAFEDHERIQTSIAIEDIKGITDFSQRFIEIAKVEYVDESADVIVTGKATPGEKVVVTPIVHDDFVYYPEHIDYYYSEIDQSTGTFVVNIGPQEVGTKLLINVLKEKMYGEEIDYTYIASASSFVWAEDAFIVPPKSTYKFSYDVPENIVEGQNAEFTVGFSTDVLGQEGYDNVNFAFVAEGEGEVIFTAEDSEGNEHTFTDNGVWGSGFDIPSFYEEETLWKLNFTKAGDYIITFKLISEEGITIVEGSESITVVPDPSDTFTVTFNVNEADATIKVTDGQEQVVAAEQDGTYELEADTYSYTVTKEGFQKATGTFTVVDEAKTVNITLVALGLSTGTVYSFGSGYYGQLGYGGTEDRHIPTLVENLSQVKAIAARGDHSLVLLENGDIYSFGRGSNGRLGHGDTQNQLIPTRIESLSQVKGIAAGGYHSLALLENGDVYSFGVNWSGQLGHGNYTDKLIPTRIEDLHEVKAIAAGDDHSLALLENGDVYSFGNGWRGRLGHGNNLDQPIPKLIESLSQVKGIAAGRYHSLALLENGDVYSFGPNWDGQLGHGDTQNQFKPKLIENLPQEKAVAIAAGEEHSLVLLENGDVYSFGYGKYGQLGHGDDFEKLIPTRIENLPQEKAVAIAAGDWHSLVLLENGDVYSFGGGGDGQLGLNDITDQTTPKKIGGLSKVKTIAAGGKHSLILVDAPVPYAGNSFVAMATTPKSPGSEQNFTFSVNVRDEQNAPVSGLVSGHFDIAETGAGSLTVVSVEEDGVTGNYTVTASHDTLETITITIGVLDVTIGTIEDVVIQQSEFDVEQAEPGVKVYEDSFDLSITGAKGMDGIELDGDIKVTVNSQLDGDIYNDTVAFSQGTATLSISLSALGEHNLTVGVDGVVNDQTLTITILEAILEETAFLEHYAAWQYIHIVGDNAYVTRNFRRLGVINISNPTDPVALGEISSDSGNFNGIYVLDDLAYVAFGNRGLAIIDVSDPENLNFEKTIFLNNHGANQVNISKGYAYVAETHGGLNVINIEDGDVVSNIRYTGVYVYAVAVQDEYAYVTIKDYNVDREQIWTIDITDPTNPVRVGSMVLPSTSFRIFIDGDYLYVGTSSNGLQIVDVSNPEAPVLVGSFDTSSSVGGIYVEGTYAFVTNTGGALHQLDVSDPTAPVEVGRIENLGSPLGVWVGGYHAYIVDQGKLRVVEIIGRGQLVPDSDQADVDEAIGLVEAADAIDELEVVGGDEADQATKEVTVLAYLEALEGMTALEVNITVDWNEGNSNYDVNITKGEANKDATISVTAYVATEGSGPNEIVDLTKQMTSNNTPSPYQISYSSQSTNSSYFAWKAFDKIINENNFYSSSPSSDEEYIAWDGGINNSVLSNKVIVLPRLEANLPSANTPRTITVYGSNESEESGLIYLGSVTLTTEELNLPKLNYYYNQFEITIPLSNSEHYRYYRIKLSNKESSASFGYHIGEIFLLFIEKF